jgi:hypothetical protein
MNKVHACPSCGKHPGIQTGQAEIIHYKLYIVRNNSF